MLYLEQPANTFSRWSGDAIRSVRYPLNIEELWSGPQLAAIGLYVPVDPGVPDGKVTMGSHVARVDGVVTFVYNLEDAPAPAVDAVDAERDRRVGLPPARLTQRWSLVLDQHR